MNINSVSCHIVFFIFNILMKVDGYSNTKHNVSDVISKWVKSVENLYAQEPRMLEPPFRTIPDFIYEEYSGMNHRPPNHKKHKKKKIMARKQNSLDTNSLHKSVNGKKKKKHKVFKKKNEHKPAHWDKEIEEHTMKSRNKPVDIIVHIKMKE